MGNVDTSRLLDTRYLDIEGDEPKMAPAEEFFPIVTEM
jgi:hypothetical protein